MDMREVWATDTSPGTLAVASCQPGGVPRRRRRRGRPFQLHRVSSRRGQLVGAAAGAGLTGTLDLVVSNPPYVAGVGMARIGRRGARRAQVGARRWPRPQRRWRSWPTWRPCSARPVAGWAGPERRSSSWRRTRPGRRSAGAATQVRRGSGRHGLDGPAPRPRGAAGRLTIGPWTTPTIEKARPPLVGEGPRRCWMRWGRCDRRRPQRGRLQPGRARRVVGPRRGSSSWPPTPTGPTTRSGTSTLRALTTGWTDELGSCSSAAGPDRSRCSCPAGSGRRWPAGPPPGARRAPRGRLGGRGGHARGRALRRCAANRARGGRCRSASPRPRRSHRPSRRRRGAGGRRWPAGGPHPHGGGRHGHAHPRPARGRAAGVVHRGDDVDEHAARRSRGRRGPSRLRVRLLGPPAARRRPARPPAACSPSAAPPSGCGARARRSTTAGRSARRWPATAA